MGYLPSFVQYDTVSLTIIRDESSQLQCLLFHDIDDGQARRMNGEKEREERVREKNQNGKEGN